MQEIIVFRNPAEAAICNFLASADGFVFICMAIVFFVMFIGSYSILEKTILRGWSKGSLRTHISGAIGVISAVAIFWVMK